MDFLKKVAIRFFPVIPVTLILAGVFFSPSCANTTTPPSGGPKDTIPPVIIGLKPLPGTVNVPVDTKIEITFNEYFTVKDPKSIFLSPPQAKSPKYRIRGRKLIVYFEEKLNQNTTYTLDLTNAIADNNEGNMYPGYTLVFSTGPSLDSMAVTGTVRDYKTLQPVKGATVLLYKDFSDSAVLRHRPVAAVKTDDWGFFALRNVPDTLFRLYAITDESGNNIYDPDNDRIAFSDSAIRPVLKARDDLPELMKYDMEDTLHCMARRSEHELLLFKERPSKQMIVNKVRTSDRSAYITFMAPDAEIDSVWVGGIRPDRLIMQFNPERDSLELWINDRRRMPDTLNVFVDYMKTDSSGTLAPFTERVRIASERKSARASRTRRNLKHEDTLCVYKLTAEAETVEQNGFCIEFNYPLIVEAFDSVKLISVNPRQQRAEMPFRVVRDSSNLRKYAVLPGEELRQGYEYILKVPHRGFRDINGFYNDSTEVSVSLPKDDKLSSLSLKLNGVDGKYIVDLLDENRTSTLRSFQVRADAVLLFPYLKKGKYSVRITEDVNENGIVDSGNLLQHRQPERARFVTLRNGSYVIDVPESAEVVQNVDIPELFNNPS